MITVRTFSLVFHLNKILKAINALFFFLLKSTKRFASLSAH